MKPTCVTEGITVTYKACPDCGYVWSMGEDVNIGYGEHTIVKVEKVNPTKTEYGVKEYYTCEVCGEFYTDAEGKNEIADLKVWTETEGRIEKLPENEGLSTGAVVAIVVGSVVVGLVAVYFVLGFTLYKKGKLTGKFFKVIYKWIK